ncbi:unnamed protein product [Tepidicaulis marinus]|uniref:Unnamed protein product n=1 Tax=Tepidicaulis marinus TaxID=1333998 RepID=A0A081B696_9HYPH|nr:hypothetical protein [Tepidicaulis marinus]GAK43564.1 unnamed protein product [Tepidicaulis marinus]
MFHSIARILAVLALFAHVAGGFVHGAATAQAAFIPSSLSSSGGLPQTAGDAQTGNAKIEALLADLLILCSPSQSGENGKSGHVPAKLSDCAFCAHGSQGACGGCCLPGGAFLGAVLRFEPPLETALLTGGVSPAVTHPRGPPLSV